ncbi:MAG: hypothetical protein LRY36_00500 [Alphaproteobacteria bacterium]|nr:hypothetical protein [Alphaproteobacteria bacterium]
MTDILTFIDKYGKGGVEDLIVEEDLQVDEARNYLADLDEADRLSLSKSLQEIQTALRQEEISLTNQTEELKALVRYTGKTKNACLSYLKAAQERIVR